MDVYGLVGKSGSGKSHRAPWLAKQRNIEYIIDDGLLIKDGSIVAGKSAKKERTKIASVKTAVFVSDDHAFEVSYALKSRNANSLLILGTSEGMIKKIAERLSLDEIKEFIHIEDIASKDEIETALSTRRNQGKHVIPVPTMELKKDFSGIYLDPLNVLKKTKSGYVESAGGKSVVRPTFSYLGKFTISEYAIYQLLEHAIQENHYIVKIQRFHVENNAGGLSMEVDLVIRYGCQIPVLLEKLRKSITQNIENLTSLNFKKLTLTVKNIVV